MTTRLMTGWFVGFSLVILTGCPEPKEAADPLKVCTTQCSVASYCVDNGLGTMCHGGECMECMMNTDCDVDLPVCTDGFCTECASDDGCGGGAPVCDVDNGGFCTECLSDTDCGGDTPMCVDGACQCGGRANCPAGMVCMYGGCVCGEDESCVDEVFTNAIVGGGRQCIAGICIECRVASDCLDGRPCIAGGTLDAYCGCANDTMCDGDYCLDGACVECTQDTHCATGSCVANGCAECATGADCTSGICQEGSCIECEADTDCAPLTDPDCTVKIVEAECNDVPGCTWDDGGECVQTGVCVENSCKECRLSEECFHGFYCNLEDDAYACVECLDDAHCKDNGVGNVCHGFSCYCDSDSQCTAAYGFPGDVEDPDADNRNILDEWRGSERKLCELRD